MAAVKINSGLKSKKTLTKKQVEKILKNYLKNDEYSISVHNELFSNLDAALRNDMCTVLRDFIAPGETIFIISHTELDNSYFDGDIHMKLELKNQYEKHSKTIINYFKHE
jgi:ABC-type thiamine transport system ATPase subunit